MKTAWNLKLFYKSTKDPQIEKDVVQFERAFKTFAKKYKDNDSYMKSETALLKVLEDADKLQKLAVSKPLYYFYYISALDSSNQEAEAMINKLSDRMTKAENLALFFEVNLGKVLPINQKKFLKSPKLKKYHYFLEKVFESGKYVLSAPEERILSLKSLPSRSLWIAGLEKSLNKKTVKFKGKEIPLPEATGLIATLKTKERRELHNNLFEVFKSVSDFAESEINAVYINKKINDELRGEKMPYSATIRSYENTEKSVLDLVSTVTENFKISHRFYNLKKKILGLDTLLYADRAVPIGNVKKKFDFKSSHDLLREIFYNANTEYGKILDRFIKDGHIDVYPKKGKGGGAFCSSSPGTPTLVFLNHIDNHNSFSTFAHEMGHAVHAERSKSQPLLHQGHTTSVAETASTFFETLAFSTVFETLSDSDKVIALHNKIAGDISTIFRQIACFNFELDLHNQIREVGSISKEDIAKLMNKHMGAYLGPAFKLTELDGYFFVNWSHIRNFFYVYSYSYGQLISKALYSEYEKDNRFIEKIDEFLSAGDSKSPERIFGDIGIKTNQALFKTGLESVEKDIDELEKLTRKK